MDASNQAINGDGFEPGITSGLNGDSVVDTAKNSQDINKDNQQNACKTCDSTQACEEDADNPGDYYCRSCWEEYAMINQQKHDDVMEQKWGALLSASDTAAGGEGKNDSGMNRNPVCNGAKGTVQSLATQSLSECEMPQTQAMGMTQPQTQALTQPTENTQTVPNESRADEDFSRATREELEGENKDLNEDEVEEKTSEADHNADSKVDGGSYTLENQAANESTHSDTLGDDCNANKFESKEAVAGTNKDIVADETHDSIADANIDNETAAQSTTAKSNNDNEADDGAASGEDFTSQATVHHENVTKGSNGAFDNSDERANHANSEAQVNIEAEQADTVNMYADDENEAKPTEENASLKCVDQGNSDDDDDDVQDVFFMTQEMNATKMTGLLTQAGTFSDNNGDDSDSMDKDAVEKVDGMHLEYEGVKVNAEVPRPPTIDTSDQIPLSGLTGPSQHLSASNSGSLKEVLAHVQTPSHQECLLQKSNESFVNDKSNDAEAGPATLRESDKSGETPVNKDQPETEGGRDHDTRDEGLTEDTFGSLYGAQTQLLPAAVIQASKACDGKCNDEHEQTDKDGNSTKQSYRKEDDGNPGTPERMSMNHTTMKITPQKGVLSMVSYPNDHAQINDTNDAKDDDALMDGDDQNETQESLDLLETSPVNRKQDKASSKPNAESPAQANTQKRVEEHATTKVGEAWISNQNMQKSPRLMLPAMKANVAKKVGVQDPAKAATGRELPTAEESDDESLFDNYHVHPIDNDPIEDTQNDDVHNQQRTSSLKRLSRGTPIYPSKEETKNAPLPISTRTFNSALGAKQYEKRSNSGSKSSITPKVLQFAKSKEVESEAEFEDDNDNASNAHERKRPLFEQSQTDYSALKKLEEIKEFTKKLPSAKEISDLASRKELQQEIEEMRKSHRDEVKELKVENRKLQRLVKHKESTIREKDEEINRMKIAHDEAIRKKNVVISGLQKRYAELEDASEELMNRLKPVVKQTEDRDAVDDNSEGESMVLSALKQSSTAALGKKQSSSKESSSKPDSSAGNLKKRQRSAQKEDSNSRPLSPQIWKALQAKGWEYKTGPEPHNKVYVPPDGSTHKGTTLGIHFFNGHEVVEAAVKRGHLSVDRNNAFDSHHEPTVEHQSENEWDSARDDDEQGKLGGPLDDTKLVGKSKLITLESGRLSVELVASFMKESNKFQASLFNPLWQRLKAQGVGSELNWRYEKINSLSRNWCYVPPSSHLGNSGRNGIDYYVTEEELVLKVLQDSQNIPELSPFFTKHATFVSSFMTVLTRAVRDGMEYDDARDGKSPKTRTRKPTALLLNASAKGGEHSSVKKQSTPSPNPSARTPTPNTTKRKTPSTSFSKQSTAKKPKTTPHVSPAFHSSQTQSNDVAPLFERVSPKISAPLRNLDFFCSGIENAKRLELRIKKLGGRVISPGANTAKKTKGTLFFLSDYESWRKPKYMFAAALGVPMLHYEWLADLEKKVENGDNAKAMSSDLYNRHKLPIGLDHSSGVFVLQRASHARDWIRPSADNGKLIFEGMTFALSTDKPKSESESLWQGALVALGASVLCYDDVKSGRGGNLDDIDCCLLSQAHLPPQVTSAPPHVSEMLRLVPGDKPRLDLAWAHQCIIQRKRLPLSGEARYEVNTNSGCNMGGVPVYSIKTKQRRFEVGDLVEFNDKKSKSYGRILSITWKKSEKCGMEVQLLENAGDYKLIDCPSSPTLFIDESKLNGNIVMLGSKDLRHLGYLPEDPSCSNIFRQIKQINESQV